MKIGDNFGAQGISSIGVRANSFLTAHHDPKQ